MSASPSHVHTGHFAQFYKDDAFLVDTVAEFFIGGIARGEAIVGIATAEHRRLLERKLAAGGLDLDAARARGQVHLLDAASTLASFMDGPTPDLVAFQHVIGGLLERIESSGSFPRTRAYGEMVDLLYAAGNEAATIRLEELWNGLSTHHRFDLLCGYGLDRFARAADAEAFARVCSLHAEVSPSESHAGAGTTVNQRRTIAELQQRARALETEIAERKETERRLEEAVRQRDEAVRRKDEFLAMLGHELRNPLAPILTALQLMDLRGDDRMRRERDIIRRQAVHLTMLVDDLLDVSRLTRGKLQLRLESTELAPVIARAVEMASPLFEHRHQGLEIEVPRDGMRLEADPARLAQVVSNLLTNAAKYSDPGCRITLSATREGHTLVITVRDEGYGISPDVLPHVFDMFVQGRRIEQRSQGGLGIGLALVQNLTRLHGGTVTAHSDGVGKGATFEVRLPSLQTGRGTDADPEESTPSMAAAATSVLVVDDNVDAAEMLAEMLRALGHRVAVAHDGPQALAAVAREAPAVALLDLGLPVMDGYELARTLRARLPGVVLAALTGYGQDSDREKTRAAGFELHLVKPVPVERITAFVEQVALRAG